MSAPDYGFLRTAGRLLNSAQTRTLLLTGDVHDLFYLAASPGEHASAHPPLPDTAPGQPPTAVHGSTPGGAAAPGAMPGPASAGSATTAAVSPGRSESAGAGAGVSSGYSSSGAATAAGRIEGAGPSPTAASTGVMGSAGADAGAGPADSTAAAPVSCACATAAGAGGSYVPLISFLTAHWDLPGRVVVVYELNGPIRFVRNADRDKLKDAWLKLRTGLDANQLAIEHMLRGRAARAALEAMDASFDENLARAIGRPTVALELLRQMCLCSRTELQGRPLLPENLIIIIEAADLVIPEAPIAQLSDADRHRVAVCQDWFSDPGFTTGGDSVILLAESRAMLHHRVSRLPQVLEVAVQSAGREQRAAFVEWFDAHRPAEGKLRLAMPRDEFVALTAGLSIHALSQLLKGAAYQGRQLGTAEIITKVEEHVKSQLGDDIVEFKRPEHTLDDVVGFEKLKAFLRRELIPRLRSGGPDALPGAAVCGPIGGGKTFIFEALAAEAGMVVLVLKNIRSQWFGQTDVLFERLRRVLEVLARVLIFVDEADTQFGAVGAEAHDTERRLTGKIQAMMSDPRLRGRVVWLLMTARIHLLSPDIRRPGRTGDLIIPVLDPEGPDREAFAHWTVTAALDGELDDAGLRQVLKATEGYSAAAYAALRAQLKAASAAAGRKLPLPQLLDIARDHLPPAITETRRYQTLQALINCTRRSLLPDPAIDETQRRKWQQELRELESRGIR